MPGFLLLITQCTVVLLTTTGRTEDDRGISLLFGATTKHLPYTPTKILTVVQLMGMTLSTMTLLITCHEASNVQTGTHTTATLQDICKVLMMSIRNCLSSP